MTEIDQAHNFIVKLYYQCALEALDRGHHARAERFLQRIEDAERRTEIAKLEAILARS